MNTLIFHFQIKSSFQNFFFSMLCKNTFSSAAMTTSSFYHTGLALTTKLEPHCTYVLSCLNTKMLGARGKKNFNQLYIPTLLSVTWHHFGCALKKRVGNTKPFIFLLFKASLLQYWSCLDSILPNSSFGACHFFQMTKSCLLPKTSFQHFFKTVLKIRWVAYSKIAPLFASLHS